ncbi:MAG: glycine betaine ABC transporter substrate-binding protein [Eubacterium ramulus]
MLGELYALALEDAGYAVDREFEVSDNLIHQAVCDLVQIDMYPEYTGTALLTILDQPMETDPQVTYDTVKKNVCRELQSGCSG